MVAWIATAQAQSGLGREELLRVLGVSARTYQRWKRGRREAPPLVAAGPGRGRPAVAAPTPAEERAVTQFALRHPQTGYKRLTWLMVDKEIAALRPYQVREILLKQGLLTGGPRPVPIALKRPAPPERPDQVWHLDLMYLWIGSRWFYLVDIVDGYSRYLVHWSLNATMHADTVTWTTQQALDSLEPDRERRPGEPHLIHDHGSQFLSQEWKGFVTGAGCRDIRTRVAHPESNGKVERLHRTHREEGLAEAQLEEYHQGVEALQRWVRYYNEERPHSALQYLAPVVYYRGDPTAQLARRAEQLAQASHARQAYWKATP